MDHEITVRDKIHDYGILISCVFRTVLEEVNTERTVSSSRTRNISEDTIYRVPTHIVDDTNNR